MLPSIEYLSTTSAYKIRGVPGHAIEVYVLITSSSKILAKHFPGSLPEKRSTQSSPFRLLLNAHFVSIIFYYTGNRTGISFNFHYGPAVLGVVGEVFYVRHTGNVQKMYIDIVSKRWRKQGRLCVSVVSILHV